MPIRHILQLSACERTPSFRTGLISCYVMCRIPFLYVSRCVGHRELGQTPLRRGSGVLGSECVQMPHLLLCRFSRSVTWGISSSASMGIHDVGSATVPGESGAAATAFQRFSPRHRARCRAVLAHPYLRPHPRHVGQMLHVLRQELLRHVCLVPRGWRRGLLCLWP